MATRIQRDLQTRHTLIGSLIIALLLGVAAPILPQETAPELTLQDIFAARKFFGKRFRGGKWADEGPIITFTNTDTAGVTHLMQLNLERDEEMRILDGNKLHAADVDRLIKIENYAFSHDRTRVLLYTDSAPIWRRNTKGYYYIYHVEKETLTALSEREKGYQMFAKFSPDGKYVAFVRNRNLYLTEVKSMWETELTSNGSAGKIINGTTDWVYEEELNLRDGWSWSPDSKRIAFYQFDESNTSVFMMLDLRPLKPKEIRFHFPLAGEPNSEVHIGVIDIKKKRTRFFETGTWNSGSDEHEYIARMGWTPKIDGRHRVWMIRLNRDQNLADLVYGDPKSYKTRTILEEKDDAWVEVVNFFGTNENIIYLEDSEHFLWLSERDGFKHLYLFKNSGELVRPVTFGEWKVTSVHGVDEKTGNVYFTATAESPLERHLYSAPVSGANGSEPIKLTTGAGTHAVQMSKDFKYFTDRYSSINTPPVTALYKSDGELVKVLEDNAELLQTLAEYDLPKFEFLTLKAADDSTTLHGYMLKPSDFDPNKQYPLLITTYGGPAVQQVRNAWGRIFALWHVYMAEAHGFIVASVDNRGASGYGKAFSASIYKNLGTLEPQDQIAAAKQWGALSYVDENRIGIWGWSYGGYNTLMSMLKYDGPETIKAGVAVAPSAKQELYDTIYTERYMSTPDKNPAGYKNAAVTNFVDRLRDEQRLLLVQGDLDDNVHYQQTVQLVSALQKANKQFRMMIYPGGNHGMRGTGSRHTLLHLFTMITDFFVENL